MLKTLFAAGLLTLSGTAQSDTARASTGELPLVTKHTYTTTDFTLFSGKTLPEVKAGWESYGTLNDNKDNVILITHYFSGTSHAAGKYTEQDAEPGYWDAIIGPGKAIDTNRFFVISVDSLANLSAYDPHVVTTGPASTNPATGKPYGLDFPVVTIRDFVNLQKQVLESLGIHHLHAVVGPSMGSMQAMDWAATYPDKVARVVSVIGTGQSDAWTTAYLEHWATPIKLDKKWQNGGYAKNDPPIDGLTASLALITQQALYPDFFNAQGHELDYQAVEQGPLHNINTSHSIVSWLNQRAGERARLMDANHLLYLVRACQLFVAGHGDTMSKGLDNVSAKTLFLPATSDLLLMPYMARQAYQYMQGTGKPVQYDELTGTLGHLEGVAGIQQFGPQLKTFLEQ